MPKFTLIKHRQNQYDSEVTVTFDADLIGPAKAHFDDFLKASGFELPLEETETFDDLLDAAEDAMWDDAFESKFGTDANVINLPNRY